MGADLYIKKMNRKNQYRGFEVSQEAVDVGYFRDCYNSGGLFAVLSANLDNEYSWWKLSADKKEIWFDKNGDLNEYGQIELLGMIEKAKSELQKKKEIFYGCGENGKADKKEYLGWCDLLINFLKLAIKKGSPVIWSI